MDPPRDLTPVSEAALARLAPAEMKSEGVRCDRKSSEVLTHRGHRGSRDPGGDFVSTNTKSRSRLQKNRLRASSTGEPRLQTV